MLANRLKAILAERNMSISTLAQNTSLSRNTISNLVNNPEGSINMSTVDEICSFLGLRIDDFFYHSLYFPKDASTSTNVQSKYVNWIINLTFSIQGKTIPLIFSVNAGSNDNSKGNQSTPADNFMKIEAFANAKQTEKIYSSLPNFFKEEFLEELWGMACISVEKDILNHSLKDSELHYAVSHIKRNDSYDFEEFTFNVDYEFNDTEISRYRTLTVRN